MNRGWCCGWLICLAGVAGATGPDLKAAEPARFSVVEQNDRCRIRLDGREVAEFVYRDARVLRPFFANVRTPAGSPVLRTHPPAAGVDAPDHDTMHPGVWLGFGDVSGVDFWRNKGRVEHRRFVSPPRAAGDRLEFATESQLAAPDAARLGRVDDRFQLQVVPAGWRLVWEATFHADVADLKFGDQEEMGFGARMATPLTEKNGGRILSSTGERTAAGTWGRAARWCDYSGVVDGRPAGVTLMAGPDNFRESWWHNRDYGLFVANPFGRAAMKQGAPSVVTVRRGESLALRFAAVFHDGEYDPAAAYEAFARPAR